MKTTKPRHISPAASELASNHFEFAKRIARQTALRRGGGVSVDDAIQAGALGLISAAEHFEPSLGVPFEAYARRRIQGAVLDFLREESPLSRSARIRAAEIESAEHILASRGLYGHPDYESLLAEELGLSVDELYEARKHILASRHISLNVQEDDSGSMELDLVSEEPDPADSFLKAEMVAGMISALNSLPEKERYVIVRYFGAEDPMTEIASDLSLSSTRIAAIRDRALERMRSLLQVEVRDDD